jgi:hypothetical protein
LWIAFALLALIIAQLALGFSSFMLFGMAPSGHPLVTSGLHLPLMLFIAIATVVPLAVSILPLRIGWRRRLVTSGAAFASLLAVTGAAYLWVTSL